MFLDKRKLKASVTNRLSLKEFLKDELQGARNGMQKGGMRKKH